MTNHQPLILPTNGAPPPPVKPEADRFAMVPLNRIVKAEANPRHTFDEQKLKELAYSIEQVGILEPLLVQPHESFDADYRLIAGERRLRAARLAGLTHAQVLIKHLTDEQVAVIQTIENRQREDVHPLEEGDGFQRLIAKFGYTPKQIAEKIGSDESFVHKRLKLVSLIPEAKEHFYAGRLTIAHYLQLARLDEKSQRKALPEAWHPDWSQQRMEDNSRPPNLELPCSVKEFAEHIRQHFFLSLKSVPWDKTDAKLYKKAGACNVCPKRTGANALLFDDTGAEDNCLDSACFAKKSELHLVQVEKAATQEGVKLVRIATSWIGKEELERLNCLPSHGAYQKVSKNDHCDHTQRAVVVHGDNIGKQFDVCTAKKCKKHMAKPYSSSTHGMTPEQKKKDSERKLQRDITEETTNRFVQAILGKLPTVLGPNEKLLLAWELANGGNLTDTADLLGWKLGAKTSKGWKGEREEFLKLFQKAADPQQTKALVAMCLMAMVDNCCGDEPDEDFVAATKAYGIDRKAIEAKVRAEFAPEPEAKPAKVVKAKAPAKNMAKAKTKKAKAGHLHGFDTGEEEYDYSDAETEVD